MSDTSNSETTGNSPWSIDGLVDAVAPAIAFVAPYVEAVADASPEVRVHLIASAREFCLAAEALLGALEDATRAQQGATHADTSDHAAATTASATPAPAPTAATPPTAASA
jgi:hypothetical protein